jgi:hypothetical protein
MTEKRGRVLQSCSLGSFAIIPTLSHAGDSWTKNQRLYGGAAVTEEAISYVLSVLADNFLFILNSVGIDADYCTLGINEVD